MKETSFSMDLKTEKSYSKNDKNAWEKFIHRKESLVTERNSGWLKN